ncbi:MULTISPECIES: hypothetical protein [Listeria]|uniref:hypothetical protein n=1 Tax=Listeria TaxID=1637 RepID=UPI000B594BCE|nr:MULTISPECIES: hypothetical protein [Listeria]
MKKRMRKKVEKQADFIQKVEVFLIGNSLQTKCHIKAKEQHPPYKFAFYVYKKGRLEAVAKSQYTKFDTNQVQLTEGGEYFVKVFVKNDETNEVTTKISQPVQKTLIVDI